MILQRIVIAGLVITVCLPIPAQAGRKSKAAVNVVFGFDPGPGQYDGVVGKPKDTWNLVDVGVTELKTLKNKKGTKTPVRLTISENDGEWGIKDHTGIYHAYIYHNNRSVDLQAVFNGLPRGRYKIYVYAHGDAPNQNAEIELAVGKEIYGRKATLNDGSWDFRSPKLAEGNQYVSFEFVVGGNEPVRVTSYRAGSSYSMFNAIQIVPLVE
jgi:hypothetical protein